ncbi:MAG TPA: hypothetical protein VGK34_04920 [Armatimonadota bacterium]
MTRIFSLAAIFLISYSFAHSQSQTQRRANTAAATGSNIYLQKAIDPHTEALGSGFRGNDIRQIFLALEGAVALRDKSEFETTEQYESRLESFRPRLWGQEVGAYSLFGFVVEGDTLSDSEVSYDADGGELQYLLKTKSTSFFLERDRPNLPTTTVKRINVGSDSYVGSNAFGAKTIVKRFSEKEYGLALESADWMFGNGRYEFEKEFRRTIRISPEQARQVKPAAKIMVVCRLEAPWIRHSADYIKPTIENPTEISIDQHYLQVMPEEIWLFDSRTGIVLEKVSAARLENERRERLEAAAQEARIEAETRAREFPLRVELSSSHLMVLHKVIDDGKDEDIVVNNSIIVLAARNKITLRCSSALNVNSLGITVNGSSYSPSWQKRKGQPGMPDELVAEISAP